jgi:hypothetical protein
LKLSPFLSHGRNATSPEAFRKKHHVSMNKLILNHQYISSWP